MQVRSLSWEDPLKEGMATYSSILAWRIPWTEEPGGSIFHRVAKNRTRLKWLSMYTLEKATAPHSSTLAWKIPWMEEPGRLQSMGSLRVRHNWATSLSLLTFMHWRRKWQPTPVFLPGESQGWGAWWATIYGVAQSRTQLKWLSSISSSTHSRKTHYIKTVKKSTKKNVKGCQGEKNMAMYTESPLGYQQIFQQQLHRPGESGMIYSKYWKINSVSQECSIQQSYYSYMKEK